MGIFDFLFGKKNELQNKHARLFAPLGKTVELFVADDKSGLTAESEGFYKSIEENYAEIVASITLVLEDEFGNWQEGFKIKDFNKEFELVSISLPDCQNQPVEWEIAFDSIHDENHMFTVTLHNFTAQHVNIDG